jgi:serine/threonine-protein kinase
VAVPNTVGDDEDQARAELEGAGFKVIVRDQPAPPEDEGNVVRQSPSGGRAKEGSTVTIYVGVPEEEEEPPPDDAEPPPDE